jgi:DNA (cytosine-5)-methyltransferase 1
VTGILSLAKGEIFQNIIQDLKDLNYQVEYYTFDASNFGIAQKRKRIFIFGFLEKKINITLKASNKKITLRDAIQHLSKIECQNEPIIDADKIIYNHIAKTNVSDIFYCRKYHVDQQQICNYLKKYKTMSIKKIDDHFGYKHTAGHWFRCDHSGSLPSANEWLELKKLFKFDDTYDEAMTTYVQKNLTYEQNLRVAKWDEPSATIVASTPQIHPNKKRRLSIRECAIVQSFPNNFMFFGSITSMHKQVGNAVPPKLAYQIALNYNNIL